MHATPDMEAGYGPTTRALHWLVAVLILVVWPLGLLIQFVREEVKLTFYLLHESFGFLILWVMLARLAVRLLRPPPPLAPLPRAERFLAHLVHFALYVALIAQPVLGFLATNAFGFPLSWFGLVTVPSPLGEDQALAPRLLAAHVALGWTILVLFALHLAGVLLHRLRDGPAQLRRMT